MSFQGLLFQIEPKVKKPSKKPAIALGCDNCTLNKDHLHKLFPKVRGKDILLVWPNPGVDENDEGKDLVGQAGRFLWKELKRIGIERNDCDIINTVKCFPSTQVESSYDTYLKQRTPTPLEIKCCSVYTETAIAKHKAKVMLVFGKVAQRALFGNKLGKSKNFYSDRYGVRTYLLEHPGSFLGTYGGIEDKLEMFRKTLDIISTDLNKTTQQRSDDFAFLRNKAYKAVTNTQEAIDAKIAIREYARQGHLIAVDIEDDDFGKGREIIAIGFSPKIGVSYTFFVRDDDDVLGTATEILESEHYKKVLHFGCSDTEKLKNLLGIEVKGYEHDTYISEYFRKSDSGSYGLDDIVARRFPEFAGYKLIIVPEMMQALDPAISPKKIQNGTLQEQANWLSKFGNYHLKHLSTETLTLYNGADCDVTKRIAVSNKNVGSKALMRLYIDLSYVLYRMEPNGPLFDFKQNEKISVLFPFQEATLLRKLKKIAGDDYKPGSPQQVSNIIYNKLKMVYPYKDKPNTQKGTLLALAKKYPKQPFPLLQIAWRKANKANSTYVESYRECAIHNNGKLRTIWKSTGTRTGRLSSGGGGDVTKVNLQNIKKDSNVKNMCVADRRWRRLYNKCKKIVATYPETEWANRIELWVRKYLPTLKTYLVADYGQVEVRVMAQLSGDKNLIADCQMGDIHTQVGVVMTGWSAEDIRNDEQTRTLTKNVHFGIMFGISKQNLTNFVKAMTPIELHDTITEEEISKAYDNYFLRYPGVKAYIDTQRKFAEEHGYVETLFGLKQPLYIKDDSNIEAVDWEDDNDRGSYWGNQAINGPVQGTAHQIMECALVNLLRKPEKYHELGLPNLEVHDMLASTVPVLDMFRLAKLKLELLEKESITTMKEDFPHIEWSVPIVAEMKAGIRLGCTIKLKEGWTVGDFLLEWYKTCRIQVIALNKELKKVMIAQARMVAREQSIQT